MVVLQILVLQATDTNKTKRYADIDIVSPYISFEEALRSDFQTRKEQKEHPELLYTRGYDPKLNYNPHQDKYGFAKAAPDDEEKQIKENKLYQYILEWIPIIIKPLPNFYTFDKIRLIFGERE